MKSLTEINNLLKEKRYYGEFITENLLYFKTLLLFLELTDEVISLKYNCFQDRTKIIAQFHQNTKEIMVLKYLKQKGINPLIKAQKQFLTDLILLYDENSIRFIMED